jgi:DeoR/GlpR family transcriptional regulator of sugar metabolism
MAGIADREKEILRLLSEGTTISVHDLSRRLGVSEVTIRKDLKSLSGKGLMVLGRGAARPAFHPGIRSRQEHRVEEKNRIARAAAGLINDGDRVLLVTGTTTALVARHLFGKRDIHLVTSSTLVFPYVRANPAVTLTLVGGEFRPETEGLIGPVAVQAIRQFHARYVFLGTDGFTVEKGLTAHLVEEAEVARAMAAQAETAVLLADSSKLGKTGFAHLLPINRIGLLITDTGLDDAARAQLTERGVKVMRV